MDIYNLFMNASGNYKIIFDERNNQNIKMVYVGSVKNGLIVLATLLLPPTERQVQLYGSNMETSCIFSNVGRRTKGGAP